MAIETPQAHPPGTDLAGIDLDLLLALEALLDERNVTRAALRLGLSQPALSAHVLVQPSYDCHEVAETLRAGLALNHGIGHVTLQVDHAEHAIHDADSCADPHGAVHVAPGTVPRAEP